MTILEMPTHGVRSLRRHTTGPVQLTSTEARDRADPTVNVLRGLVAHPKTLMEGGEKLGI